MKIKVLVSLCLAAVILVGMFILPVFGAETYPSKPVRLVVPFTPGGGTDFVARCVGEFLSKKWGQQLIVDNRPGGTTIVGTEIAAKSRPDGYTLLLASATFAINIAINKKLPYDPIKDLEPITQTTLTPYIFVVNPSIPVKSVKEFIAFARANPDRKFHSGNSGTGGGQHFALELFKLDTGLKNVMAVPYRGTSPALTDLLGGHIEMMFSTIMSAAPHVRAGKLRALAVSTAESVPAFPDVPPIGEAVPGYEASSWNGIMVPAGVPKDIMKKLNKDIVQALKSPKVKSAIESGGGRIGAGTPEEFAHVIDTYIKKWSRVVKENPDFLAK